MDSTFSTYRFKSASFSFIIELFNYHFSPFLPIRDYLSTLFIFQTHNLFKGKSIEIPPKLCLLYGKQIIQIIYTFNIRILHFRYTEYFSFMHTVLEVSLLQVVFRDIEFLANQ
jgi:hypothetical protein